MNKLSSQLPVVERKSKRKKLIFLSIFSLLLLVVVGCFGYQFYKHKDLVDPQKLSLSNKRTAVVNIQKDPFIVLLMGTDGRKPKSHNWRPDVLMLAAVNPKTKSIKLISIPRDLYVEIANTEGAKDKINAAAAYAYNKKIDPIQNVRETVENLLNVPIDYYAKVNFQGFMEIVDVLGGVNVNVEFPFHQRAIGGEMVYFEKGPAHLNGSQALAYVRMRHQDPNGDAGRNKRQRAVIQELIDQLVSVNTVTRFSSLVTTVADNFQHSFSFSEIPTLAKIYKESKGNIQEVTLTTTSGRHYLGGVNAYIEKLSEQERQRISTLIQKQIQYTPKAPLSPSTETTNHEDDIKNQR
ncbi:transcriptional attenuator, LytR family [Seinonella peptonophila]|uniref:Transcriptional attenuator, LytR family n=1 Tax=Seinonella peptonophila TaxID=112248 RepID=A0A1M4SXZ4_9BACL|nr:LCP family protein [Seinonella peptonophila]SHE37063.1 transcriptional attenuator, LytR family [Seinonella peptonophila]